MILPGIYWESYRDVLCVNSCVSVCPEMVLVCMWVWCEYVCVLSFNQPVCECVGGVGSLYAP